MDQEFWDARYGEQPMMWSGNPNGLLVVEATGLRPGRALDVGCGEGADALWLAHQGWQVTGVDISGVALRRAALTAATGRPATFDGAGTTPADHATQPTNGSGGPEVGHHQHHQHHHPKAVPGGGHPGTGSTRPDAADPPQPAGLVEESGLADPAVARVYDSFDAAAVPANGSAGAEPAGGSGQVGDRIRWVRADLTVTAPPAGAFDLVAALYFPLPRQDDHAALRGLLAAVAPGGTLLVGGHHFGPGDHRPSEPHFDPDLYYGNDEIVDLLGAGWSVETNEVRDRVSPAPPGSHHVLDTVLRVRRVDPVSPRQRR